MADVQPFKLMLPTFKVGRFTRTSKIETMSDDKEPESRPHTAMMLATFCLCIFLACLDAVIIGNALPAIADDLHMTLGSYAWVGAAYNMAWASLLLTWAKVADIFGRRPVLLIGASLFFIGSIIAATARSAESLIAGRTVQGLGAGAWLVTVSICITDIFSLR